jgi:hypothetical protein
MSEFTTADGVSVPNCLATERRVSVRYSTNLTTLCQKTSAETNDFWLLAKIQDLSVTGVRLLLGSPFKHGAMVDVEPIKPDSGFTRLLRARVVYCRQEPTGGWTVGCEFPNPLTTDELQSLL